MAEKKIGSNVSSGAKKVETVEKKTRANAKKTTASNTNANKQAPKKAPKKGAAGDKKTVREIKQKAAELKEEAQAEKRVIAAKARAAKKEKKLMQKAERKQKHLQKKAEIKEKKLAHKAEMEKKAAQRKADAAKRKALLKEKRAERKAERIARKELLRHESKAERKKRIEREKKEQIALKRQKKEAAEKRREQKLKSREAKRDRRAESKRHKREQRTERRKHAPGFGGWLAAVISLGVACLALATVVTAGSFKVTELNTAATGSMRSTLYEMAEATEDMDDNFAKLRVSSGANEQRRLLTEVLVDTALLENALERCPVDAATSTDISAFVNNTNTFARNTLKKLASGVPLTEREKNTVAYLYRVNGGLYRELTELSMTCTENDLMDLLGGKAGMAADKFTDMGRGMHEETEEELEAPFSGEGNVGENMLAKMDEITASKAEELVKGYLGNYHVKAVEYTGETSGEAAAYNFVATDENGIEIFAQISKNGGKLLMLNTYEICTQKNFDLGTCDTLAREFLSGLGIENVEAVRLSDAGMVADLTYVSCDGGVRAYSDMIRIRVCESKGRVVGMDATGYYFNHTERNVSPELSESDAEAMLSGGLTCEGSSLAIVPVDGEEVLCYEFDCKFGEEQFIVYIDANTGDEVLVYRVLQSSGGTMYR